MALTTSKVTLPRDVAAAIVTKVGEASTIAKLSPSEPVLFRDKSFMVFNPTAEAEVVGEGQKKGSYETSLTSVVAKTVKVQTTTRTSDELVWADEDNQLEIVRNIQADQAAAIARALDYIIYHAVNPRAGTKMDGYDALTATAVQVIATDDARKDVDALSSAVNEDYDINGVALSRKWANTLRTSYNTKNGTRNFPDIPLNLDAGTLEGIKAATSATVNGRALKTASNVLAVMGDFALIKWGMVRDMTASIIPYGDPDQTGVDLQANGQIAYRTESVLGFAVLDPSAFAVLKSKADEPATDTETQGGTASSGTGGKG